MLQWRPGVRLGKREKRFNIQSVWIGIGAECGAPSFPMSFAIGAFNVIYSIFGIRRGAAGFA